MLNSTASSKPKIIKILICSANMGNEQPDLDSLHAWIPCDGYTKHVLGNPPYPIRTESDSPLSEDKLEKPMFENAVSVLGFSRHSDNSNLVGFSRHSDNSTSWPEFQNIPRCHPLQLKQAL
jgi:hypothetical protein